MRALQGRPPGTGPVGGVQQRQRQRALASQLSKNLAASVPKRRSPSMRSRNWR